MRLLTALQNLVENFGCRAEERFIFIFSRRSAFISDADKISLSEFLVQLTKEESERACRQLNIKEKALLYETMRLESPKPANSRKTEIVSYRIS